MSELGGIFAAPKITLPTQTQTTVKLPDRRDPAVVEEGRRRRREQMESRGRESTRLSGTGAPRTYDNNALGE